MKPLLTTMLASAAVCALCSAPAVAGENAPDIHVAFLKSPMRIKSVGFAKTNIKDLTPKKNVSYITETVDFTGSYTGTQFVNNPIMLWATTWYAHSSGGKCVQPPKQKQKYTKPTWKYGKVTPGTVTGPNYCGTSSEAWTYLGPKWSIKPKWGMGVDTCRPCFTGYITAKNWNINAKTTAKKWHLGKSTEETVYDVKDIIHNTLTFVSV